MANLWLNDSGTVRETSVLWVNDGGTIREVSQLWALMGTTSQLVYSAVQGVPTFVDSEVITSGTTWTPSTSESYRNVHVWVIGAGGGGGAASTSSGREKISNGGGAGGTAYRVFTRAEATMGATVTIGAGGAGITVSGGGSNGAGFPGGNTIFTLAGTTMTGNGGEQGKGGRNTDAAGSTVNTSGGWGAVSAVSGGTASGGTENYTGGGNIAYSIGGDGSQATSGGSVNLSGQSAATLNGTVVSGGGFQQGAAGPRPSRPSFPDIQSLGTHWPSENFNGGAAQQHSSGGPVTGAVGNPYGAGGGSASAENSTATSGAGGNGAVVILYEGSGPELPAVSIVNGFTNAEGGNFAFASVFTLTDQMMLQVPNNGPNETNTLTQPWSREISNGDAVFFPNRWPDDGSAYANWSVGAIVTANVTGADVLIINLYDRPTFDAGGGGAILMVEPSTLTEEPLWDTATIGIRGTTSGTEAYLTMERENRNTFGILMGSHNDSGGTFLNPPGHQFSFASGAVSAGNIESLFTPTLSTASGFIVNEPLQLSLTIAEAV